MIRDFLGMAGGMHSLTTANAGILQRVLLRTDAGGWMQSLRECDYLGGGMSSSRARIVSKYCSSYGTKFGMRSIRSPSKTGGTISSAGKTRLECKVLRFTAVLEDAPSCIFVGPIETAEKARLEALYQQARDSYYSGQPLVVDDMFDKVELQLRWHGSKLVLKYPRCSLRRFTAYADAEVDPSQMQALKTVWSLLFALGLSLAVGLPILQLHSHTFIMSDSNRMLFSVVSFLVGVPVSQAAMKQLQALGRGDLVALKGNCPNCGEEVYTFVKPDLSSLKARHESECHICERQLIFQATLHPAKSGLGPPWAHGRVYLQTRANQLAPARRNS